MQIDNFLKSNLTKGISVLVFVIVLTVVLAISTFATWDAILQAYATILASIVAAAIVGFQISASSKSHAKQRILDHRTRTYELVATKILDAADVASKMDIISVLPLTINDGHKLADFNTTMIAEFTAEQVELVEKLSKLLNEITTILSLNSFALSEKTWRFQRFEFYKRQSSLKDSFRLLQEDLRKLKLAVGEFKSTPSVYSRKIKYRVKKLSPIVEEYCQRVDELKAHLNQRYEMLKQELVINDVFD